MGDDITIVKAIKKIREEYETGQIGITEMAERILATIDDNGWKEVHG